MTITRTIIPTARRADHVGRLFGVRWIYIESFVFDTAASLSPDYDGGSWQFYTLSNGAFYMAPEGRGTFAVAAFNGYEGQLSADAFGIAVCMSAFSMLSFNPDARFSETCASQYHLLRAFMLDHQEVGPILRVLD